MDQIVQVLGSLLILSAFVAAQRGWLSTQSRLYLSLNLFGASVLAVLAANERQLGFLLLEFVWALVAAYSLLQLFLRRGSPAQSDGSPYPSGRPVAPGRATDSGDSATRAERDRHLRTTCG